MRNVSRILREKVDYSFTNHAPEGYRFHFAQLFISCALMPIQRGPGRDSLAMQVLHSWAEHQAGRADSLPLHTASL